MRTDPLMGASLRSAARKTSPQGSRVIALGSALLLALLGGCLHAPSTSVERAASFEAFAKHRVGDEALPDFVSRRTALLIGGMPAGMPCTLPHESIGGVVKAVRGRYALGSATAIDRRGYFLTAAHCVDWQPLHALYSDGGHLRIATARVVWRGDASANGCDLALLSIDRPVSEYFSWADTLLTGEPVIGAGPDYDPPAAFGLGYFSGVTLKLEPGRADGPVATTVYHTAPVHLGDSGGPLTTPDGRLIAINVGDIHELDFLRFTYHKASQAHRPDLDWLRETVQRDFASNQPLTRPAD